jgi:hypothetical protein
MYMAALIASSADDAVAALLFSENESHDTPGGTDPPCLAAHYNLKLNQL